MLSKKSNIDTIPNTATLPNIIPTINIPTIPTSRLTTEGNEENLIKKVSKIHLKKLINMQIVDYSNQTFN